VASGPYDLWVTADIGAQIAVPEFSSAANGQIAYQWDGDHTITTGVKSGGTLIPDGYYVYIDFQGIENQYVLTYESRNKYRLTSGVRDADNYVQFAEDLYANTNIPADLSGSRRMEVRVNGTVETNYRFYDLIDTFKNVVVFNTGTPVAGERSVTGPVAGSVVSVDYATPSGNPVNWGMATLGETTNNDGLISANEARTNNGVFNDFWSGQAASSITVQQPNRNKSFTLTLDPNWTVQDFINAFNARAAQADVEAEAYWNGAEVSVRPGTSGWKERPDTGWEGSLFYIDIAMSNIGPGGGGDLPAAQNTFAASGPLPADSVISVVLDDTGRVMYAANTSSSNEHDLPALGFILPVKQDAAVGAFSVLKFNRFAIQAGANDTAADRINFSLPEMTIQALSIENVSVARQNQAVNSIGMIDTAINRVNSARVYFGVLINRCEHTLNNLFAGQTNSAAGESVIRDADFAFESATFTRNQILLESSRAVLSQANMMNSVVRNLLSF